MDDVSSIRNGWKSLPVSVCLEYQFCQSLNLVILCPRHFLTYSFQPFKPAASPMRYWCKRRWFARSQTEDHSNAIRARQYLGSQPYVRVLGQFFSRDLTKSVHSRTIQFLLLWQTRIFILCISAQTQDIWLTGTWVSGTFQAMGKWQTVENGTQPYAAKWNRKLLKPAYSFGQDPTSASPKPEESLMQAHCTRRESEEVAKAIPMLLWFHWIQAFCGSILVLCGTLPKLSFRNPSSFSEAKERWQTTKLKATWRRECLPETIQIFRSSLASPCWMTEHLLSICNTRQQFFCSSLGGDTFQHQER